MDAGCWLWAGSQSIMDNYRKILCLLGTILILGCFMIGCDEPTKPPEESYFHVFVLDQENVPIRDAQIHGSGGSDWYSFSASTDTNGIALLPDFAHGHRATIDATNYYPFNVDSLATEIYILVPTEYSMRRLGTAKGRGVSFDGSMLATIVYQGSYNTYGVTTESVSLLSSEKFPTATKNIRICGDTLWVSVHSDTLFAYSIQDPTNPRRILALDVGGNLNAFAFNGDILALADPWNRGPIRILRFSLDGDFQELASFGQIQSRQMEFIDGILVVLGYTDTGLTILSIDSNDPVNESDHDHRWWYEQVL